MWPIVLEGDVLKFNIGIFGNFVYFFYLFGFFIRTFLYFTQTFHAELGILTDLYELYKLGKRSV